MAPVEEPGDAGFAVALRYQNDPFGGDRSLAVRFFTDEIEDAAATATEGRPIFKSVEMCEIQVPGERDTTIGRVKSMHPDPRDRFPEAYARWKRGETEQVVGTLLREWGLMPRARAKEYEALKIRTVEQLAGVSDTAAQDIRGSLADRQKARDFLEFSKGQAPLTQARAEMEVLRNELQAVKEIAEAQGKKIDELTSGVTAAAKRGKG